MKQQSIILIGGGHMGGAMALRWQRTGAYDVQVIEADAPRRNALTAQGISCHARLADAPLGELYILAIKPQQFSGFVDELKAALSSTAPLLVSIMAGVPLAQLHAVSARAVRVMPNLPAVIGESMSVLCAPSLDAPSRARVEKLFAAIGAIDWLEDETLLHAVTGISGSGPAYVFALMEALVTAAIAQGLNAVLAKKLVAQTLRGAALLASESPLDAATLRAQVTSKGGTSEAALEAFAAGGFKALIGRAVDAAVTRSKELAKGDEGEVTEPVAP